jgi:hypothetical protein
MWSEHHIDAGSKERGIPTDPMFANSISKPKRKPQKGSRMFDPFVRCPPAMTFRKRVVLRRFSPAKGVHILLQAAKLPMCCSSIHSTTASS